MGCEPNATWDDIEARQRELGEYAAAWLREQHRPDLASPGLDWIAADFEPRWVGFDAAECLAALQPSIFSGRGADEFDRFRHGAAGRGELAMVISTLGQPNRNNAVRNIFGTGHDSVHLGRLDSAIGGSRWARAPGCALLIASATPTATWRSGC